ncbi:methyltransferase domain-containing protein [Fomitiporia mediterranea MF3/22]|uniref:methyltransferase domain-containing protein n=1 Tax=Fomitiporia mediterranea (strain MF3/22) TaxID=694068 RepID=UPI0004408514|nr:methyltransferase domain-containing protein [Fomitiporia mediterranea MF3/22]EJD02351.1 methyltransferase domain-containing protein [Fomitiporia mediterranea MF3/22]
MIVQQLPNVKAGIDYWNTQPANLDGVLGGFGSCALPRIDALSSRHFILNLFPQLSTVPSAIRPLSAQPLTRRTRALDVGAGIGRVTSTVLLHLFSDVVLVEPATHFVQEALRSVSTASRTDKYAGEWKGVADAKKSVTVVHGTLQDLDPRVSPESGGNLTVLGRVGYTPPESELDKESGFDVIWCQWCLGHLSDEQLTVFLKLCKESLRSKTKGTGELEGVIVVKENICLEKERGVPRVEFDTNDSTLIRSDLAWKNVFANAGLIIVKQELQTGFPQGLYPVKMYALR